MSTVELDLIGIAILQITGDVNTSGAFLDVLFVEKKHSGRALFELT